MYDITFCSTNCKNNNCLRNKKNVPHGVPYSIADLGKNQPKNKNCKYFIDIRQMTFNDIKEK